MGFNVRHIDSDWADGIDCPSVFLWRLMIAGPFQGGVMEKGRVIIATRENEDRMRMIGYNPVTYRTIAFVSSSIFAGLAGALYSIWNTSASPTMISAVMTINALIMTILGGIGTLVGPILGAAIMQTISQFFYTWFGARWPLVFGVIFIQIVMFLPYGIIGTWRMKRMGISQSWNKFKSLLLPKDNTEKPAEAEVTK